MSVRRVLRDRRSGGASDESGFAMIIAVVIGAVGVMLVSMTLATSLQLDTATIRSRRWNLALQVAEAGAEQAIVELTGNLAFAGTSPATGSVPGGEYVTVVETPTPGYRRITSTGYVPSRAEPRAVKRRIRVEYGPGATFNYALYSDTTLNVKNDGGVFGSVFANEAITVNENSTVTGVVISATGSVQLENNAKVLEDPDQPDSGSVLSGGFNPLGLWGISLSNNAEIQGDARAQVEDCGVTTTSGGDQAYNIVNQGVIGGEAVAGGLITGGANQGTQPFACELRQPRETMPEFHWDPTLYTSVTEWGSAAAFTAGSPQSLTGTHYVNDPNPSNVIQFAGKTIVGDFNLITNTRFRYGNDGGSAPFFSGPSTAIVNIIVLNSTVDPNAPSIDIENQLDIADPAPAVLFYSTGLIDVKNDADTNGAVYAGLLSIKNNLNVTYDPRVERSRGFGPARFERVSFLELPAGT